MKEGLEGKDILQLFRIHIRCMCEIGDKEECEIRKLHEMLMKSSVPYLLLPYNGNTDYQIIYLNMMNDANMPGYKVIHDPAYPKKDRLILKPAGSRSTDGMRAEEVFEILAKEYRKDLEH